MQLGKKLGQDGQRIGNGAAEDARVQILRRTGDFDLVVVQPAQAVGDRGHAARQHGGVRDDQRVGLELGLVVVHIIPEVFAADLLFAFDDHLEVDRQLPGRLPQGIERANVNVHLAFVVGGAAAIEIAVANGRLEGRRGPQFERLGRLHVVVPVKKNRGLPGSLQRFAINQRMHFRRNDFDAVEAHAAQPVGHPLRGALDVRFALRLRADAGNAQKFVEIGQMLVVLPFDVFIQLHRSSCGAPILGANLLRCKALRALSPRPVSPEETPQRARD